MTVKEYNEWRKEFGHVQVLLYAFPNVLKKIGNDDLIKELEILGYDKHTLDFLNDAMCALEKVGKENLFKDTTVLPDTTPAIPAIPKKKDTIPVKTNYEFYKCDKCIHIYGVDCFRDQVNDIPCPDYKRDPSDGGSYC